MLEIKPYAVGFRQGAGSPGQGECHTGVGLLTHGCPGAPCEVIGSIPGGILIQFIIVCKGHKGMRHTVVPVKCGSIVCINGIAQGIVYREPGLRESTALGRVCDIEVSFICRSSLGRCMKVHGAHKVSILRHIRHARLGEFQVFASHGEKDGDLAFFGDGLRRAACQCQAAKDIKNMSVLTH